jgi:HNH endonuclease
VAVFRRRESAPGPFLQYSRYRPYVREDFAECCAYCLLHEVLVGGEENFELDHFRPQALAEFSHLRNDFYNLYYACHVCNNLKGGRWPGRSQEESGYGFVDFCADPFSAHFEDRGDGFWVPLSRRAEYTLDKLRLNRTHLVRIRQLLRSLSEEYGLPAPGWSVPLRDHMGRLLIGLLEPKDRRDDDLDA